MNVQLSLWAEPATDTHEFPFSWADGCQELPQLERLAGLLKCHRQTVQDDSGKYHLFTVLSTRIEGGRVLATCREDIELERRLGMFRDQLPADEDDC